MKKRMGIKVCIGIGISLFLLCGCSGYSGTTMSFSFNAVAGENWSASKELYIKEDTDCVSIQGELKLDSGAVTIMVVNQEDNQIIWNAVFKENQNFAIQLENIKAKSNLLLRIYASDCEQMHLFLSSEQSFVEVKERKPKKKPRKPIHG